MGQIESFGDSSRDIEQAALTAVADFINTCQPGSFVQRFVLIVETADEEDRWISAFVAPGQKKWDSLGLLGYATALEANGAGHAVGYHDDEDDDD